MAGRTEIVANKASKRDANAAKKYFENQQKDLQYMRGISPKHTFHIRETKLHGKKRYIVYKKEK